MLRIDDPSPLPSASTGSSGSRTSSPLYGACRDLLNDHADLNTRQIIPQRSPSVVDFAKQVGRNYPAIYTAFKRPLLSRPQSAHSKTNNAAKHSNAVNTQAQETWIDPSLESFPAIHWSRDDLIRLVTDPVEVAVTPNGRADDLHNVDEENVFLEPAVVQMSMSELLDRVSERGRPDATPSPHSAKPKPVHYLQSQNSNLTFFPSLNNLHADLPQPTLPFATLVLGEPEATNIWIGDDRSVTSTHRDPFENLYLVLRGTKTFRLYPPVAELALPVEQVRTGKWVYDQKSGEFTTEIGDSSNDAASMHEDEKDGERVDDNLDQAGDKHHGRIPWISLPSNEESSIDSLYMDVRPLTVTVREGQILYLPVGWYHHVSQTCGTWDDGSVSPCIAVNWWFDMDYEGDRFVMRDFLGKVKGILEQEGATSAA